MAYFRGVIVLLLHVGALSCGPSTNTGDDGQPMGPMDPCTGNQVRCVGSIYQECRDGTFTDVEVCQAPQVCAPSLGCADCNPMFPTACMGDNVHTCNSDGTLGGMVEACGFESCQNGSCGGDECAGGQRAELIYVVDESNNFLSFDPSNDQHTFTPIGVLSCPAGPSWPDWGNPQATPFSMSVDRNATAWVLYTSGEIFHVSTEDASCQPSGFQKGQMGFELFGMGFVTEGMGSDMERLFIAGGDAGTSTPQDLGWIDPASMTVTRAGTLPSAEFGPELTGTGDGELFGYYPGINNSFVARIDKSSGQTQQMWPVGGLGNQVRAWAFAHWGGRFYIFVTTADFLGNVIESKVQRLDPMSGQVVTVVPNVPYVIVGAGVSTCAPVYIP